MLHNTKCVQIIEFSNIRFFGFTSQMDGYKRDWKTKQKFKKPFHQMSHTLDILSCGVWSQMMTKSVKNKTENMLFFIGFVDFFEINAGVT